MSVTRIALISGSHRPQGASTRLATELQQLAHEHIEGCETEMVPIDDLPFWDESLWGDPAAAPHWDGWRATAQRLRNVDGLIVVAPEYAGMVPPRLVNFLLLCSGEEVGHKPALAVGVSATRGGTYPIAQLRASSTKNNHMCWLPDHLILREARAVDTPDALTGTGYVARYAKYCIKLLGAYAKSLKEVRCAGIIDHGSFPYGM
jgi:NAD(P)H-dependent FMN reductase